MPRGSAFRRNLLIIGLGHVLLVAFFFALGSWNRKVQAPEVTWLDGGSVGGGEPAAGDAAAVESSSSVSSAPELIPVAPLPVPAALPLERPLPSELAIATPQPATPRPATPKPATPRPPTPRPATPKPATPKAATPKPATPREASPKPASPKPKPSPKADATAPVEDPEVPSKAKGSGIPGNKSGGAKGNAGQGPAAAKSGAGGPGAGNGKGPGKAGGGQGLSQYGWYFSMLHDRFHARWEQPTSIDRGGAEVITTLKLRIGKDGAILEREIVKSSGYPAMDESVLAAARKIEQIDPLPAGLGTGEYFEVNLQFKLDQAQ